MPLPGYAECVRDYVCTADHHDRIFREFTAATWADPLLAGHRRHIEANQLGFGDPAFHAMWRLLLDEAHRRFGAAELLEIGVFKGQVVSLWALLARTFGWPLRIGAITPFAGQPMPRSRWTRAVLSRISRQFRERVRNGDFYPADSYETTVRELFAAFDLDFNSVRWIRGYSDSPAVLSALGNDCFHVIYVDGGHTYEAVAADIENYGLKVAAGGWIVMDDAACDLPGTAFWKGHEAVSRACRRLPDLGFKNVFNVGHNRIFEKA